MQQCTARITITASLLVISLGYAATVPADTALEPTYQIIRATDTRVWRLNTRTGEIAVCSLDSEQLVCSSSEHAIAPPAKTYAELEGERRARAELEIQRKAEKRKRSLAMLDRMFNAFRGLAVAGAGAADTN